MAAPILPSLFPHPPLAPHHQLYFPPPAASVACWNLPPPPVQFYPSNNVTPYNLQPSIVGVANFNLPGSGPGFRGRGGYYHQRGMRGRGRGGINRRGHTSQNQGVVKKSQRPAEFSCKVCNKEYRSEESYQIHLQSHRKCSLCDFQAVPRVLKEHELLHYLPDELKLTSPEEIKKWREDRRQNYPTAENIARRKKSNEEKKARGEVARTPLYRYIKRILGDEDGERFNGGGRWKRGRGRGRRWGQRGGYHIANCHEGGLWKNKPRGRTFTDKRSRNSGHTAVRRRRTESESTDLSSGSTLESKMDEKQPHTNGEINSLDECDLQEEKDFRKGITNAIMVNVASVAAAAGVSPGADCMCLTVSTQQETSNDYKQEVFGCEGNLDPTNACDSSQKDNLQQPHTSRTAGKKRKWAEGGWNRRDAKRKRKKISMGLSAVKPKKPTLLEMLLAPEIRREQNAILQCIHHVIKQDFFGLNT